MASLGHVAIGMAAGRLHAPDDARARRRAMVGFSALSLLPDADVIAFAVGIPYEDAFGHRGASHALLVAVMLGLGCALFDPERRARAAAIGIGVAASHGLLDAMTTGGLGVALLWPFSDARVFFGWRPIPVAPIGAGMLSARGLYVLGYEAALFCPLLLYAFWRRRASG